MADLFNEDLFLKGLEQRKATLGAEYVEKNLAAADEFTRPFQEAMTAWWRPLLPRGRLLVMGEQSPPLKFPTDQLQHRRYSRNYIRAHSAELSQRLVTTTDYLHPWGRFPVKSRSATTMRALAPSRCTVR